MRATAWFSVALLAVPLILLAWQQTVLHDATRDPDEGLFNLPDAAAVATAVLAFLHAALLVPLGLAWGGIPRRAGVRLVIAFLLASSLFALWWLWDMAEFVTRHFPGQPAAKAFVWVDVGAVVLLACMDAALTMRIDWALPEPAA